jgi:HAE1 family hydrophobic/amphiphilic exporter-1
MINKQSGTNTVAVANNIRKTIAQLEKELPGVKFNIMMDQSIFVRNSINHVFREIILGVVLAVFIIWLFLRNLRSTLIIATSLPVSLIATFILLYFSNTTLNLISMGGLAIGVGLIVDDSIVVLENIYRQRTNGLGLIEAANVATDEVAGAVTSSTLTTIAVFLPIVFIQGLAAEVFKPMAYTVSFSVLASLVVAFTIVPLLASRLLTFKKSSLTGNPVEKPKRLRDNWFERLKDAYRRLLTWALSHRRQVIILVVVLFLLSLGGAALVGAEFFPNTDQGYVNVSLEMPKGTSLTETNRVVNHVEEAVKEFSSEIKAVYTGVGYTGNVAMGGSSAPDLAQVNIELVKKNERAWSADEMADKMRQKIGTITGVKIKVTAQDPARQGMPGMTPVEVKVKGDDLAILTRLAEQVVTLVEKTPGTRDVSSSLGEGRPEVQVMVDRNRAAMYGLAPLEITSTVRTAIDGVVATRYRAGNEEVDLRVQLAAGSAPTLDDLANLMISSPTGTKVPLAQVATLKLARGPNEIEREDQTRMITVGANLEPGKNLNSVIKEIKNRLSSLALPPGYTVEFGGEQEIMSEVFQNLLLALVLAVLLIYLIMVAQFESTLYPFIIMFSVPVTLIGVVVSLLITGRAFSVTAFIGIILLVGIVVKNAIILIDYVNKLRQRGLSRNEALLTAGPIRLRPILMTALTVILAMSPLALGIGEGAEIQAPMATVVIGGLLFSTLITLVLVPVIYTIFDDWKEKWSARR